PVLRLVNPQSLDILTSYQLPPRPINGSNPLGDLCGAAYFYLDAADRAVVGTTERTIRVVAQDPGPALRLERTYDLTAQVPADDCVIALMPDWSGHIWFETKAGRVGAIDPATGQVRVHQLTGEAIA